MKRLVILTLILSTGVIFAQRKGDKNMKDMPMGDHMMMAGEHMMGMPCSTDSKGKKGRGKHMMSGGMMQMSPSDEAAMKKNMMDRGMTDADATKMMQLRKDMMAIMQKYMDSTSTTPKP
ncbi:MAG: hypothetical protein ACRCY4_10420 [Brevinema sp.]